MIDIDLSQPTVAVLKPEGALSAADFDALRAAIDGHINRTDIVPNLVIDASHLPHWDSLAALEKHLKFVRDHHRVVKKVAIVGDSPILSVVPALVDHFVGAKVRRFPTDKMAKAKEWANAVDDDPGRFDVIDDLPRDVVALKAVGIITAQDYRDTLVPLVEAKLKEHDKLKFLIVLGEEYATYAADAAWDDTRFGIAHWGDFSRIALVTDIGWMTSATKLFAPLMGAEVAVFPVAELEEAKSWIRR